MPWNIVKRYFRNWKNLCPILIGNIYTLTNTNMFKVTTVKKNYQKFYTWKITRYVINSKQNLQYVVSHLLRDVFIKHVFSRYWKNKQRRNILSNEAISVNTREVHEIHKKTQLINKNHILIEHYFVFKRNQIKKTYSFQLCDMVSIMILISR